MRARLDCGETQRQRRAVDHAQCPRAPVELPVLGESMHHNCREMQPKGIDGMQMGPASAGITVVSPPPW